MKKVFPLFLAMLMALSLCACGADDGGKTEDGGKDGKVTAAKLTQVIRTEKGVDGKDRTMKSTVEYDEDHYIIATKSYLDDKLGYAVTYDKDLNKPLVELTYDDNGEIIDRTENTYDKKGNCVEKTSVYTVDGKDITLKRISTYDANGNVLTEASYEDGKLSYEQRYTYTADGKLARESYINSDGLEEAYTENTYDDQGNLLSVKVDGMLSGSYVTYENTYENGKLVEVKVYDQWEQDGELTNLVRYDAQGNITLRVGYENSKEWSRTEYTYENDKLIKVVDFDNGEERYVELYTYNAAGKLTERSRTVPGGESQRSAYSYDEDGNITSFKQYEDGELSGEYILTYETVIVPEAVAEQLRALVGSLALD